MNRLRTIFENPFARGSVWLTAASIIGGFANYIFTVFAGRLLGPVGYSDIMAFLSYTSLLTIPVGILQIVITNTIAKTTHEKAKKITVQIESHVFRTYIVFLAVCAIAISLLAPFFAAVLQLTTWESAVIGPYVFAVTLSAIYLSLVQGLHIFFWYALISLIGLSGRLMGLAIAYTVPVGSAGVLCIMAVTTGIGAYVAYRIIRNKTKTSSLSSSVPQVIQASFTLKRFLPVGISIGALTAYNTMDMIAAKQILSAEVSGIYASWTVWGKLLFYILGPITPVLFVFFSRGHMRRKHMFTITIFLTIAGALCCYFFYTLFGDAAVRFVFGMRFVAVIPYLGYAAAYGLWYAMIHLFYTYFLAQNHSANGILALSIPIYIFGVLCIPKDFLSFIMLNIVFSASISLVYWMIYRIDLHKAAV